MSIIKLENLLGSENWTEWFEGLAPEEATKFLSLGEEAWKKLDSIGTDDLLSWQILYELDDGQWEALQSMGLAQSGYNGSYQEAVLNLISDNKYTSLYETANWSSQPLSSLLEGVAGLIETIKESIETSISTAGALAQFLDDNKLEALTEDYISPFIDFQSELQELIESVELMPSQVANELQTILNETINEPLGLNESDKSSVTITSTLPTLTEIANGLDSPKRELVIDFGGAKLKSIIELPLKEFLGTSLGIDLEILNDLPEIEVNLEAELQGGIRLEIDLDAEDSGDIVKIDTHGINPDRNHSQDLSVLFEGNVVSGTTEIPTWLGISQSDIENLLVVGGSANLDLQTTKENPSYDKGLVALQDIGEGMTYETSSDFYIKLNTDVSSSIVENIGKAVEDRITALSDAFDVGTDLASWVNLINEVSDLVGNIAEASESIGELPDWVPESAKKTYTEFSSGLGSAAEGISALKNEIFDSEEFVELINDELNRYETGLSLNLLAKPSSDKRPTETQEYIGSPQILNFSTLAADSTNDQQPFAESGEFQVSEDADWSTTSEEQNFKILQLEENILRDTNGIAITSFINEQAVHITGLTYKLDLASKNIDFNRSSISENEIVVVIGEQTIIPESVDLVSSENGEKSLLITLQENTIFEDQNGVLTLPVDFEEANGKWAASETTRELFESDLIKGFEYSEKATEENSLKLQTLSVNTSRPLHYKLEVEKVDEQGEETQTVTVIVDKENGVEAHYLGNNPPTGLQYIYAKGIETGQALTRKHLEQQSVQSETRSDHHVATDENNTEALWRDVTETKREYFETFHEYGKKLEEGIVVKKIEMNTENTLNYQLTLLDINQENKNGNKETTEIIVNIDWKNGIETHEIGSETVYTRNIDLNTLAIEETGEPAIDIHLKSQPSTLNIEPATTNIIPKQIAISYANPVSTVMVDRGDGNGYTEIQSEEVFVGTKNGDGTGTWKLKDSSFKLNEAIDSNAVLTTSVFDNFIENGFEINPIQLSRRMPEILPFASLGDGQRQVAIVASTSAESLTESATEEILKRMSEIEGSAQGSIDNKIWKLLNYASVNEDNLKDAANHDLTKLRAYSALQILLETGVINESALDQTLARTENSNNSLVNELADSTQPGLSIRLDPEGTNNGDDISGVSIDLGFHREGEVDLIIKPGTSSETSLYVFELSYHEGSELNGRYEFSKDELLTLAKSGHKSLADGLDSVFEAISADINAAIDLEMDLDGRIVFAYDFFAPVTNAFSFDPRGLGEEINDWPEGSSGDQHTLGLTLGDETSPTNSEITASLGIELANLELNTDITNEEGEEIKSTLEDPEKSFSLTLGTAIDVNRTENDELEIDAGMNLDLDLDLNPVFEVAKDFGAQLGEAFLDEVNDLVSDLDFDLDSAELRCWRTLIPAIANLLDEISNRFNKGAELIDRLPSNLSGNPVQLISSISEELDDISNAMMRFQDSVMNPEALVKNINSMLIAASVPMRMEHSSGIELINGVEREVDQYALIPSNELSLTQTLSLEGGDFAEMLEERGLKGGAMLVDIASTLFADISATFDFNLESAGSLTLKEYCDESGSVFELVNTETEGLDGYWPDISENNVEEAFFEKRLDNNSQVNLSEQELAIAAGFELSQLNISIPLLKNNDGSTRVFELTPEEAYETMSLRIGMGVDAIDEEKATKKLTDALEETELEGGVRLNLTEKHLVQLGNDIQQEVKEAGLALVDDVQKLIDSFSSLTMPECAAGWFGFLDQFITTMDDMSDQLVDQLAVLKDQTEELPDWMPSDWLYDAEKLAQGFAAVGDELSEFRDQWLTTESFIQKVNTIFRDNDLDIHLRLLAGPESMEAECNDKEIGVPSAMRLSKGDILLESNGEDHVVATFLLSKEQEAQFAAVEKDGLNVEGHREETIQMSDFIDIEDEGNKQSVLTLPLNTFGLPPTEDKRLEITLTDADGSALTSANIQTAEGTGIDTNIVYIEWSEEHQGYAIFNGRSEEAKRIIIAGTNDGAESIKLRVSHRNLYEHKAVNIQAMNLEQVLRTSEGEEVEGLYAYTFTPSTTNSQAKIQLKKSNDSDSTDLEIHKDASAYFDDLQLDAGVVLSTHTPFSSEAQIYPVSYTHLTLPTTVIV